MIVNSAYLYMGKKELETAKNELWTNGELNYQFTILNGNASFDSKNNRLVITGGSSVIFTGLDFSNYNTISITCRKGGNVVSSVFRFEFVLPDGSTYGGGSTTIAVPINTVTYSIENKTANGIKMRASTTLTIDSVIWN